MWQRRVWPAACLLWGMHSPAAARPSRPPSPPRTAPPAPQVSYETNKKLLGSTDDEAPKKKRGLFGLRK